MCIMITPNKLRFEWLGDIEWLKTDQPGETVGGMAKDSMDNQKHCCLVGRKGNPETIDLFEMNTIFENAIGNGTKPNDVSFLSSGC
jgi:N6-adenosine-specific RNA methylase IME4